MASVNTLCKSVPNVKNTVIKNCNLYSDKNGVKHIRIQARPNKWHGSLTVEYQEKYLQVL